MAEWADRCREREGVVISPHFPNPLSEVVADVLLGKIDAAELRGLFDLLAERVDLRGVSEFTVEANPGTLDRAKLHLLRSAGVNRLSLGAQSFSDRLLGILGRRHASHDIREAVELAHDVGFTNLSLDLIFAVPTQKIGEWRGDLDAAIALNVPHVSAYSLTYEQGTPMHRALEAGELVRVNEDDELAMYELAIDTLTDAGYEHYEISNFARPGSSCAHNEVYWANDPYLGAGPSAVSYVEGVRLRNVASVEGWCDRIDAGESPVDFRERLDGERRARETAVMNLRRTRGIDFDEFLRKTGFDARVLFADPLRTFSGQGLMALTDRAVRLTRRGLAVADTILSELV
jgi:oxygen-independent coproporphyrinogen-3 oxidase